ncbi:hypothetical protein LIER_03049 [Lithospermum erythrorhizon]|uniref:Uncharacterized protein n=1 Tax=Lithospermum erythrorhizon TaxID=34254 RepID=A0AAV3NRR8_LITER
MDDVQLYTNRDDIICPICLDSPHNCVLLQCSSHDKGCRSFVREHDHTGSETNDRPICPLCRGEVTGWIIPGNVRLHLDEKKRCCDEAKCVFEGTFKELRKHVQLEHPNAKPPKIDPARELDWENFQQSSEIIDVLSTIHAEVPRGVVLGDYVIEYGDNNSEDDFNHFPIDKGNWWTSCIFYQVFDSFRTSRNRRRLRVGDARRGNRRLSYDASISDEGSVTSVEYADYGAVETDDELVNPSGLPRRRATRQRHCLGSTKNFGNSSDHIVAR